MLDKALVLKGVAKWPMKPQVMLEGDKLISSVGQEQETVSSVRCKWPYLHGHLKLLLPTAPLLKAHYWNVIPLL